MLRNLRKKQVSAVSAVGAAASVKRRKLLRTAYNSSHPVTDPTAPSLRGLLASVDAKQQKLAPSLTLHASSPTATVVGRNTHARYYAVTFCTRIQHASLIPPSLNCRRPKSSCTRVSASAVNVVMPFGILAFRHLPPKLRHNWLRH